MESIIADYGPVYVTDGYHKGRIGYYDDDHTIFDDDEDAWVFESFDGWEEIEDPEEDGKVFGVAIVYFGDSFLADSYTYIPHQFLRSVTTDDLFNRKEELLNTQGLIAKAKGKEFDEEEKLEFLRELYFIDSVIVNRMVEVRYSNRTSGSKVFISHSSEDKRFAKYIASDLKAAGHTPWLDEWAISVGESIPAKISEGLEDCHFVVVILSEKAVNSKWVEKEWQSKYWDEVSNGSIHVLPVLYENCKIPELLKTKRYADFKSNYNNGLEDLLLAIDRLSAVNESLFKKGD